MPSGGLAMTSILDAFPYPLHVSAAQSLLNNLHTVYPDQHSAILIAQQAGLDTGTIDSGHGPRVFWKDLLYQAARDGLTRQLVQKAHDGLNTQSPVRSFLADLLANREGVFSETSLAPPAEEDNKAPARLVFRRVPLGSITVAGFSIALITSAVYLLTTLVVPSDPIPIDKVKVDTTFELVDPQDPYEPIQGIDRNSVAGRKRYHRMRPLEWLCSSLYPQDGKKNYTAVVAIRSEPFVRSYRPFTGSTKCARVYEDDHGPITANPTICFAFLVTEDKENTTVLRSLTVSNVVKDPDDHNYDVFTYSVPESRKNDRLFVIIGLSKESYEFTEKNNTRTDESGFTIRVRQ